MTEYEKWCENVTTYTPGALQVLLEAYDSQMALMVAKRAFVQLLLDLDSRPSESLPRRMDTIHEAFSALPRFDMTQWRKELDEARTPPDPEQPAEGGSTWIAKSK